MRMYYTLSQHNKSCKGTSKKKEIIKSFIFMNLLFNFTFLRIYVCSFVFIHVCINTVLERASINFLIFCLSFYMLQGRVTKDQKLGEEMELSIVFNIF